jgi:hypothetical protein
MSRRLIAAMCTALGCIGFLGGCGGGSSSVDTTSTASLCPAVLSAQARYAAATGAMGLQFENLVLETRARKTLEALLLRVEQLQGVAGESQRDKLASLALALSNQLKTFRAFEEHDRQAASQYGNSINAPLRHGLADLRTICGRPH